MDGKDYISLLTDATPAVEIIPEDVIGTLSQDNPLLLDGVCGGTRHKGMKEDSEDSEVLSRGRSRKEMQHDNFPHLHSPAQVVAGGGPP